MLISSRHPRDSGGDETRPYGNYSSHPRAASSVVAAVVPAWWGYDYRGPFAISFFRSGGVHPRLVGSCTRLKPRTTFVD